MSRDLLATLLLVAMASSIISASNNCYNQMCAGAQDPPVLIPCDQSTHVCSVNETTKAAICTASDTPGDGINCTTSNYYCGANETSGDAVCIYKPWSCYDSVCEAGGEKVDCDQSTSYCSVNKTSGAPLCLPGNPGHGINCTVTTEHDEYYCSAVNGSAVCVYPPVHSCYDTMCLGVNDTSVPCDQETHRCGVKSDGTPECIDTTRGAGTDCTGVKHQDFYCSNNASTGAAVCVETPAYDCYNQTCTGTGNFSSVTISCDQATKMCALNDTTGEAICSDKSRGAGVNCSDPVAYCGTDAQGGALCVVPPVHQCYDTKCWGSGNHSEESKDCNQATSRCVVDEDGVPTCIAESRGSGVDCYGTEHTDFYCSVNATSGSASCMYTPPFDCYDKICFGTGTFNDTKITCDNSANLCTVNGTGYPVCDPKSRGAGVNCTHTSPQDYWCGGGVEARASCVFTPEHTCYAQQCAGTGDHASVYLACDGSANRCGVEADGSPKCIAESRGAGVDCNTTSAYYCSYYASAPTDVQCVYPTPHDCYNTKCQGALLFNETFIGCKQDTQHCSVNASSGFPLCVNDTSGAGVDCQGRFSCAMDGKTGVAACKPSKGLLPLWIVVGIIAGVLIVALIVFIVRKRQGRDGDRTALIGRETGY